MRSMVLIASVGVCLVALCAGSPLSRQKRSRQCFEGLDCFTTQPPFNNTDGLLPQDPLLINTTFRLYTETCKVERVIHAGSVQPLLDCGFDPSQPLRVIVHGFLQHGQVKWIRKMANVLLTKERQAVITVDWGSGSGFPYSQASANTQVVGAEIARLLRYLRNHQGVQPANVHLIGHSLGAHVCGYAGHRVPGIGRITGLDPAEPDFKDTDPLVHLDRGDAVFVDVIHSDGSEFDYVSGFGWIAAVGHIDFYPNGGENQPGCLHESVSNFMSAAYYHGLDDAEDTLSCSHSRSIYLFTESITSSCPFYGHPCDSLAALDDNTGNCLRCAGGVCPQMGYRADRTGATGRFYLRTRGSAPYCGQTQHVQVKFGNMEPVNGQMRVELLGRDRNTDLTTINSGSSAFVSGGERDVLMVDSEVITDVIEVRVRFSHVSSYVSWWWSSTHNEPESVSIAMVTVTSAEDGRSIHFCGAYQSVTNGNTITLSHSTTDPNDCLHAPPSVVRHNRRH